MKKMMLAVCSAVLLVNGSVLFANSTEDERVYESPSFSIEGDEVSSSPEALSEDIYYGKPLNPKNTC